LVRQFDVTVLGKPRSGKPSVQTKRYSERDLELLRSEMMLWLENKDIAFMIKEVGVL